MPRDFSEILSKFDERILFRVVKVARGYPSISHIFFVDDNFIFVEQDLKNAINCDIVLIYLQKFRVN